MKPHLTELRHTELEEQARLIEEIAAEKPFTECRALSEPCAIPLG